MTKVRGGSQEQRVIDAFDTKAPTYAAGYEGDSGTAHSFTVRRQRVYEMVGDRRSGRMLDVGCGPGVTADHFVKRGFELYGVDIAPEMIHQCHETFAGVERAHFTVGVIEQLEFPDAFFDVVTAMGVVEYIEDDARAVAEMARVTRPGGIVIVTLPNAWSPFRIWQRTVYQGLRSLARIVTGRGKAPAGIAHREYREREYCRLLESHGLRVADVVYYNFRIIVFPFDRWMPRVTVALSRALERFGRGSLRWLGTGFIVKAEKA